MGQTTKVCCCCITPSSKVQPAPAVRAGSSSCFTDNRLTEASPDNRLTEPNIAKGEENKEQDELDPFARDQMIREKTMAMG